MLTLLPKAQKVLTNRFYRKSLSTLQSAAYSSDIYEFLIKSCSNSQACTFSAHRLPPMNINKANIYIRHDIDTENCVSNANMLIDINLKYKSFPGVYIRTDDIDYNHLDCRSIIERYQDTQVTFGLHTSCYQYPNYVEILNEEISKFSSAFGYNPRAITVHGYGHKYLDVRLKLNEHLIQNMSQHLLYTDCSNQAIEYNYIFEDCYSKNGERYIKTDFIKPPKFIPNRNYLILTHPCYWAAAD